MKTINLLIALTALFTSSAQADQFKMTVEDMKTQAANSPNINAFLGQEIKIDTSKQVVILTFTTHQSTEIIHFSRLKLHQYRVENGAIISFVASGSITLDHQVVPVTLVLKTLEGEVMNPAAATTLSFWSAQKNLYAEMTGTRTAPTFFFAE